MLPSTSKTSTPNWLDRLRTSKGFPDTAAVDLEHFLTSPDPNPDPPPPDPPAPPPSARHPSADTNNRLSDILTNVLADLFIIGPPRPRQTLAEPKKQRRPKQIRIAAAAASGGGSFSADNARRLRTKTRKREAGGAGDVDLSGYSRTDVTVIDTSLASWKVEKVIFRKGAVWKVRDRKVRVRFRKRRKVGLVERLVGEKERGEESGSGKAVGQPRTHKIDTSRETDDHIQIPIRRLKSSRSPRVPATRDSSIFRLQVISSNMTNGPICASGTPKGTGTIKADKFSEKTMYPEQGTGTIKADKFSEKTMYPEQGMKNLWGAPMNN